MRRRRREPPISPLLHQGFPPGYGAKAVLQVVREIHQAHFELEGAEIEAILLTAIKRARKEREKEGAQ